MEVEQQIYAHWTNANIPIARNLVFRSGRAQLKVNAGSNMYRTYCLMLILGMLEWGTNFGFINADMTFKNANGVTLGTGSFG